MKIGIIGLNKVGLTFGFLCQESGFDVFGSDINQKLVYELENKFSNNLEVSIRKLLYENKNLKFVSDPENVIVNSDIIFIFTTPKDNLEGKIDISELLNTINTFYELSASNVNVHNKKLVICGMTNLGDMSSVYERLKIFNTQVAYHPQFFLEPDIVNEFKNSKILLVGTNNDEIFRDIVSIYSKFHSNPINSFMMSFSSSEITRMAIHAYYVMKTNFSNMVGDLLGKTGLQSEINLVLTTIREYVKKQEDNFNHNLGFGGPILPKDNRLFSKYIDLLDLTNNIPKVMDEFNKEYIKNIKNLYVKINPDKTIPFVIDSISYDKNFNSIEESQRLKLCIDLLEEGYYVNVIENDDIIFQYNHMSENYNNRLRFYPKNTTPKGIKINL